MKIHSTIIDYDKIIFVGCFGIFIDCLLIEIAMFDQDNERFSLGIKQLASDPLEMTTEN